MIRALIFDCFGVLYTDPKSHIVGLCPAENRQELYDLFQQADYGFISGEQFSVGAARLIGVTQSELDAMTKNLYVRNEALIHAIRTYQQHYKIGLLSNVSDSLIQTLFTDAELKELFNEVVLSSRVGMTKPAVGIFELIAERLGVLPEECVMIDDIARNVEGAQVAGMRGVQFVSTEQALADVEGIVRA